MTKEQKIRYEKFMDHLARHDHYAKADDLLTLTFVYGYDIDWYPLLVRRIGNW